MQGPPFVGRKAEIESLSSWLVRVSGGHGGVMLIEGDAGMGKTELLKAIQEEVRQLPELGEARFAYGTGYEDTGAQNAYQPLAEILGALTAASDKRRDTADKLLSIIKETAPDWIQIIPGIGAAVAASIKTTALAGQWFLGTNEAASSGLPKAITTQYISTILKIAPQYKPLVMVIEDGHWIDRASCHVILRLVQRSLEQHLAIIIAYRPNELDANHPLHQLRRELLSKDYAQVMALQGLSKDEIRTYIQTRFGTPLHPDLAVWLTQLCDGNPLFVVHYLSLLEQRDVIQRDANGTYTLNGSLHTESGEWILGGALADLPVPRSVDALLEERIEHLEEEDREMLQIGAVEGEYFLSSVLAELLEDRELHVLSRLRRVVEKHRIIELYAGDDWTQKRSEVYAFEHVLMQQAFYRKLSPRERTLYHAGVAQSLEHLLSAQANPSRKLILDVAHHYELCGEPLPAARYYYQAAQSCFRDGAFDETVQLCQNAVRLVRSLTEGITEHDRLRAEILQLLMIASELWWRGKPELQGDLPLEELAKEAEAAATRLGDRSLLARVKYAKGTLFRATAGLAASVAAYREALADAREVDDLVGEFMIMSELGHRLAGEDLDAGLEMLYKASELYESRVKPSVPEQAPPALTRLFYRLQASIGVNEFDRGNFGDAEERLTRSSTGLGDIRMHNDLVVALAFIGQLYTATGRFEGAEMALRQAIDLIDTIEPHAWRAYLRGLLGKLYLEWERISDAVEPLHAGWEETLATWNADIAPIVANHYVELLIHPEHTGRDLAEAERLLIETLNETKRTGFHRSFVAALSLRGHLALMQERVEDALTHTAQAVEYLQRMGTLPALRTEEVLFVRYRALLAAHQVDEAQEHLIQADTIIQRKATSLKNEADSRRFLERVLINRSIRSALQAA